MKNVFRKIHLWLSVPFGIFITLICFSGAMMVFEREITELCRPDLYFVKEVKEKPLPIGRLMHMVSATLPDSVTVTGVTVSPDARRTWQVSLSKPRRASLYVNPYTGEVTGRSEKLPFYDTMFHLHRWMLGASAGCGKTLVGVSTLMLVVILITGILMWLTNRHKPLRKSLVISFSNGWPRFWHDLHVAGGIYATVFLLALALTGLTWSFAWYRTAFYGMFGVEASAEGHGADRTQHGKESTDGAARGEGEFTQTIPSRDRGRQESTDGAARGEAGFTQTIPSRDRGRQESPEGSITNSHERHHGDGGGWHRQRHEEGTMPSGQEDATARHAHHGHGGRGWHHHGEGRTSPFAHWQKVYEELAERVPDYRQITLSEGSASVVPSGRRSLRAGDRFDFDPETGRITGCTPYAEQDKSTHVRSAVYTVHVGSWGGWLTRIVTFLAALLGATLPLTGYYLWIRRLLRKSRNRRPQAVG